MKFPILALLILLMVLALPTYLFSKDQGRHKPDTLKRMNTGWKRNAHIIALGFGAPNYINDRFNSIVLPTSSYSISSLTKSINLHLKFEFFLAKHLGLGANLNYGRVNYDFLRETGPGYARVIEKTSIITDVMSLNLRLNYHFLYNKVIDVYLGAGTGIRFVKTDKNYQYVPDIYSSGFFREHELSLGVRYFAKGIVGMFAEVGFGRSVFQVGVNFNIKG